MTYEYHLSFAKNQDHLDPLAAWREQFHFPQHDGKNMLYFTGNSLGLQPKTTKDSVLQELEDWAKYGVEDRGTVTMKCLRHQVRKLSAQKKAK
jgi:kynureninase